MKYNLLVWTHRNPNIRSIFLRWIPTLILHQKNINVKNLFCWKLRKSCFSFDKGVFTLAKDAADRFWTIQYFLFLWSKWSDVFPAQNWNKQIAKNYQNFIFLSSKDSCQILKYRWTQHESLKWHRQFQKVHLYKEIANFYKFCPNPFPLRSTFCCSF